MEFSYGDLICFAFMFGLFAFVLVGFIRQISAKV